MIKAFTHQGLQRFFKTGSKVGIQAAHASKLARQLRQLNDAVGAEDTDVLGWNLHPIKGQNLKGGWSVWINGNWRLTFLFDGQDAILVDYQDYH